MACVRYATKDTFPKPEGAGAENMTFIFLGCMAFGFLIAYVFHMAMEFQMRAWH